MTQTSTFLKSTIHGNETYPGNKLRHKLHHSRIIPKLPNKHSHLLHRDTSFIVPPKDIMNQLILELLVFANRRRCIGLLLGFIGWRLRLLWFRCWISIGGLGWGGARRWIYLFCGFNCRHFVVRFNYIDAAIWYLTWRFDISCVGHPPMRETIFIWYVCLVLQILTLKIRCSALYYTLYEFRGGGGIG